MKKIYIGMSADLIHNGHLNIIENARRLNGKIIIGLLTDKAIASYKRLPFLEFNQRKIILENIKDISEVIPQDSLDYTENLEKIKPDYVLHGDDWKSGIQSPIRDKVIKILANWGGKLIEIPYTHGISSTKLNNSIKELGTSPELRLKRLRRLISAKPIVKICESHSGLSGLIVENASVEEVGKLREFDGIWISSLTQSAIKGKPDIGYLDTESRFGILNDILDITTKPIIYDADNGGPQEHFSFTVKSLERVGVSAVIIEDKTGLKKNSLFGTEVSQQQEDPYVFAEKIKFGKNFQFTEDFMIIARIESLILEQGMEDALKRAQIYIDAGADGIMIHSREKTFDQIKYFSEHYNKFLDRKPLVVVPSSYSAVTEEELINSGINVVIYANHLLRSAYPAMKKTAESILSNHRCKEASENYCMSIKEIINLIPGVK